MSDGNYVPSGAEIIVYQRSEKWSFEMPQTMLAILAMVITTLFAFNQHRNVLNTRLNMVREDMAVRATSVAVDVIEEIGSMAYDEATRDKVVGSSTYLTTLSSISFDDLALLDSSLQLDQESGGTNDIDDFNGAVMMRTRTLNGKTLTFRAESIVTYVDETDKTTEVSTKTKLKKATIRVYSLDLTRPDTLYLSQIYSCGTRCNW